MAVDWDPATMIFTLSAALASVTWGLRVEAQQRTVERQFERACREREFKFERMRTALSTRRCSYCGATAPRVDDNCPKCGAPA